jgi:3-oxoacyl-(acyl-carrier-protein) synthase III
MKPAIGILGTGSYLPARVVTNAEIAGRAGVDAEWIERKTGIVERRRAAPDEATSDLAAVAAGRALTAAGVSAGHVDYIVLATSTPDHPQPATASIVQSLLGASSAAAVDVNAVCSGFVYAMAMAEGLIMTGGGSRRALVIGADIYSRILDYDDRRTAILFGDGAGAVVLGPVADGSGLMTTSLRSYGEDQHLIGVPAGGSRLPASADTVRNRDHFFQMDGRGVRGFVSAHVPGAVSAMVQRLTPRDRPRHLVLHQANGVMLRDLYRTLDLPDAELHLTVDRYGNTGAASIPITLDAASGAGRLAEGEVVLFAGFGGGMNLGLSLCRWTTAAVSRPEHLPQARAALLAQKQPTFA